MPGVCSLLPEILLNKNLSLAGWSVSFACWSRCLSVYAPQVTVCVSEAQKFRFGVRYPKF